MGATSSFEPLTVMISSRCSDKVSYEGKQQELAIVRKAIKAAVEKIRFGGRPVFKVWIHEDEPRGFAWDQCMQKSKDADIFIALYNGNSGWSGSTKKAGSKIGICHAEFETAFNQAPAKVCLIQFPAITPKHPADKRFQEFVGKQSKIDVIAATGEEAVEGAKSLAVASLLALARAGVGINAQGSYYAGEALAWTRMDFAQRREVTTGALVHFLSHRTGAKVDAKVPNGVLYPVSGERVAFVCDCIPAGMGTAAARELVGQPFLRDHKICRQLPKNVGGPVHVIACQKGVTENQALNQLGFPDAVVVTAPFGVYVADDVQKIQMVFIPNCRDEATTRHRIQRFLLWLDAQGEGELLAQRAMSRRKIGDLIAAESV